MPSKEQVYDACIHEITKRLDFFYKMINDLKEGAMNDAKSSAGDKHETSRAMMQIEQEKAAKQLNEALEMKQMLEKINTYTQSKSVGVGSFIKTNIGYFYIAVPIGKLNIFNQDVFVISAKSPLGAKLIGLKSHDSIDINAKKVNIEFVN